MRRTCSADRAKRYPIRIVTLLLSFSLSAAACTTPERSSQQPHRRQAHLPNIPAIPSGSDVVFTVQGVGSRSVLLPKKFSSIRSVTLYYTCSADQPSTTFPLKLATNRGPLGGSGCGPGATFSLGLPPRFFPLKEMLVSASHGTSYRIAFVAHNARNS
jgi:hypothetical protein